MQSSLTPAVGNFEQPILEVGDPQAFGEVQGGDRIGVLLRHSCELYEVAYGQHHPDSGF